MVIGNFYKFSHSFCSLNVTALIQYILLFIFATVHGTVYWLEVWRGIPAKPAIIFLFVLVVWLFFRLSIHRFIIMYIFFNIIIHGICGYIQQGQIVGCDALGAVMPSFVYIFLVWVFYKVNPEKALTRFVKFTAAISLFSVICFFVQNVFGTQLFAPISNMHGKREVYGFLFYFVATRDMFRNYGMFGEPGIYQILVNVAIFVMLFWKTRLDFADKSYNIILAILIITVITINSTIGFIELGCIIAGILVKGSKKLKKRITIFMIIIFALAGLDFVVSGDESIIIKNLVDKIIVMNIGNYVGGFNESTSGGARLYILSIILDAFRNNMLWGIGDAGLDHLLSFSQRWRDGGTGNAFGIYLIRWGLIPTLAVVVPVLYRIYSKRENLVEFAVIVSLFFITAIAQSQLMYASYLLLAFGDISKKSYARLETN